MKGYQGSKSITDIIKLRINRLILSQGYINLLFRIVFITLVGYLIFTQVFLIARVKGNDMFPALKDGDLAIIYRLHKDYVKNDVVFYKNNGKRHVGRVIAKEEDVVNIDENGTLYVNGTVQNGEILYPTHAKESFTYPYRVEKDSVFILGDFRTKAEDSRDYGPIHKDNIEGKIISILRRRGL